MELNICHLYPDLMNVYGDTGNVLILKYRAQKRGVTVNTFNVSMKQKFDSSKYDIVLFGGGQDFEQSIICDDLIMYKKEALKEYIENGKVLLAICGGYQLLGRYYMSALGEKLEGLGILELYTDSGNTRFIGNTVIKNETFNETYVGFENHSGRTYIGNLKPFGKVLKGYGNNGEDGYEGCQYKNTFCTYFHGPVLSKNPEFADRLILNALKLKYGNDVTLEKLNDEFELNAKNFIIEREAK